MALIACRECKKKVSAEAKTCPQCGAENPAGFSENLLDGNGKLRELTASEFKSLSYKEKSIFIKAGGKHQKTIADKIASLVVLCIIVLFFAVVINKCSSTVPEKPKTPEEIALDKLTDDMFALCQIAVTKVQPRADIQYGQKRGTITPQKNSKGQWETAVGWTAVNAMGVTVNNQTQCIFDKDGKKVVNIETVTLGFEK